MSGSTYTDCDVCEDCGLVDCVCDSEDDWDDDDDYDGDGPCECDECADDDDDTPEAAAAEYVRNHNGDLFRQPSDLGTSEGKKSPDFDLCPHPFRGAEFDEGDPAGDWLRSVDSLVGDEVPPPVPIDELADNIREDGGLDETPALALLDEIQRLRAAPSDYNRGIADALAVIDSRIAASESRLGGGGGLQLRAEIYGAQWIRGAVAALKRGSE
jgi:hypothetical protein